MTSRDQALRELVEEFRRVALDRLARINVLWIELEREPDGPADELLRELHTLKGEARMMGFPDVAVVAHHLEDLAGWARERRFVVPREVGDLVMAASDAATRLLDPEAPPIDVPALARRFAAVLAQAPGPELEPEPEREPPEVALRPEAFLRVGTAAISSFSEGTASLRARSRRTARLVRRLHELVQVGPARAADVLGEVLPLAQALREELEEADLLVGELDAQARDLRLVPIATLFERYVRVVRDLGREHGKDVAVEVRDAGVRVDKAVLDRMAGPLAHLLRNAVDHGVETADERVAAGKPAAGTIVLSAEGGGGRVTLSVADDGRGVDPGRVRGRAVELGFLDEEEARDLDHAGALRLLFRAGFSTTRAPTETSGRGIGLDAVKRDVERVGGSVRLRAERGEGTTVQLRLPASIALTGVLVVRIGGDRYALPNAAIAAVASVPAAEVREVHQRPMLPFGGELLPLVDAGAILGRPQPLGAVVRAVVVDDDERVALAVGGWEQDLDAVVKPLGELEAEAPLFSGACALEEGELVLVLNPAVLLARARGQDRRPAPASEELPAERGQWRVLLAEDSAITRSMLSYVLADLGYRVVPAQDGQDALEALARREVDLVVTDIDMPFLDGIELTRRIRADDRLRRLPVVILSTRGGAEDRRRAAEAGADAHLLKSEFSEATLRDVLAQQLGRGARP